MVDSPRLPRLREPRRGGGLRHLCHHRHVRQGGHRRPCPEGCHAGGARALQANFRQVARQEDGGGWRQGHVNMALSTPLAAPTVKSHRGVSWADHVLGVVMLVPALTYIALLVGLPFLLAVFFSLTNASAGSLEFSFVGVQNFKQVMASPVFQRALRNTFVFTFVSQLAVMVLG